MLCRTEPCAPLPRSRAWESEQYLRFSQCFAYLDIPEAEHPAERQQGCPRRLHPQLILRLLPVLGGLLDSCGGSAVESTKVLLTRQVFVKGVWGVNGLIRRGGILSPVFEDDLCTPWMVLGRGGRVLGRT